MKRKLVFATNNAHKLEEVAAILGDQIELLSLNDIDCHTDIPETADTLEGTALRTTPVWKWKHWVELPESIPHVMQAEKDMMRKPICLNFSTS